MFSLLLVEQLSVDIRSVVNFVVSAAEPSPLQTLRDVCQHTYHKAWAAVLQLLIIVVIYVKDSKQSLLHLFFFLALLTLSGCTGPRLLSMHTLWQVCHSVSGLS